MQKTKQPTETAVTYEPMLATVFNHSNLAENLVRFGEMKQEALIQKSKKYTTYI